MTSRGADFFIGDIHVRARGDGPPALLLHGNGEDWRIFARLIDRFAPVRQLIAPDSRGHGRSRRGSGPLTIARMSDDAARVRGHLTESPVDVVGFSDGANVAMELALRHPGAVRSLVLISGNLDPSGMDLVSRVAMRAARIGIGPIATVNRRAQLAAEMLDLMLHDPYIRPEALARIDVPTLVIAGDRDMIPTAHTQLIADSIPGARLALLRGDHFLLMKRPDAVLDEIAAFWELAPSPGCCGKDRRRRLP